MSLKWNMFITPNATLHNVHVEQTLCTLHIAILQEGTNLIYIVQQFYKKQKLL